MRKILFFLPVFFLVYPIFSINGNSGGGGVFENHVSWQYSVNIVNDTEAEIVFTGTADKDWHFYTLNDELNPIIFKFNKSPLFSPAGKISQTPRPKKEYDDLMSATREFYEKSGTFKQKIKITASGPFDITGSFEYQTCFLDGICQIEKQDFKINVPYSAGKTADTTVNKYDSTLTEEIRKDTLIETTDTTITASEDIKAGDGENYAEMSLLAFFLAAFLSGLIALMTPCIYPMIPMTISFFMHDTKSRKKSIIQACIYGLSIIIIYEIIGTLVALTMGESFTNWLSTHWLPNIFFFLLFLVFAASFFGMFEITLPSWLISKSDKQADKGGYLGAFFMAFTLVLVSFSCTAPIAGAILAFSTQGMVLKPVVGMLGYSLAFALPFTFFAIFPSALKSLPKSGGWLNSVKVVLGFIELALALKFLSVADQTYHWNVLDREVYLSCWIAIFALMGVYLLGKLKFAHDSELKFISVPRIILAVISFSFVIYMIPGLWGAPLKALTGWIPPMTTQDFDMGEIVRENTVSGIGNNNKPDDNIAPRYENNFKLPHGLKGYFDYQQALSVSAKLNKPVFIDFTGHGCVNCRKMEEFVWVDSRILKLLREEFIIAALYVDDHKIRLEEEDYYKSADGNVLTMMGDKNFTIQTGVYKTNGQPFYYIVDSEGRSLIPPRGGYNPDIEAFLKFLQDGLQVFKSVKAH